MVGPVTLLAAAAATGNRLTPPLLSYRSQVSALDMRTLDCRLVVGIRNSEQAYRARVK
jgi:hypothetical protein